MEPKWINSALRLSIWVPFIIHVSRLDCRSSEILSTEKARQSSPHFTSSGVAQPLSPSGSDCSKYLGGAGLIFSKYPVN